MAFISVHKYTSVTFQRLQGFPSPSIMDGNIVRSDMSVFSLGSYHIKCQKKSGWLRPSFQMSTQAQVSPLTLAESSRTVLLKHTVYFSVRLFSFICYLLRSFFCFWCVLSCCHTQCRFTASRGFEC